MGFPVTVETSPIEDIHDFIYGNAFDVLSDIVAEDCIQSRRALLTSLSLTSDQRVAHLTKLRVYKYLYEKIFEVVGKQLPSKYLELFTGAETES